MASHSNEEKKLSDIFQDGFVLYESLGCCDQPTNCSSVQIKIKRAMKYLEDATRLVSIADLFSSNESVEEVSTGDLQYFLLPALLGNLALKLCVTERMEVVNTAEIYFRDFLQRCYDYGITREEPPPALAEENGNISEEGVVQQQQPSMGLAEQMHRRTAKLQRYSEQKAFEKELADLKKALSSSAVDDEAKRKYYLALIKYYVSSAFDELDALQSEREILKYLCRVKKDETLGLSEDKNRLRKHPKPKPLMPIIITRDEAQKKVFGAGYPSLPTVTVQEFYDQRVADGVFPDASTIKNRSLIDRAAMQNTKELAEREEEDKEQKVTNDDEETLRRARDWDEHKDSHRRGEGNRYNRS